MVFASQDGLKNIGKIHKVTLTNLKSNTKYAYRIYSREVLKHNQQNSLFGNTVATRVYKNRPLYFNTLNPDQKKIYFIVISDIHENSDKVGKLLEDTNFDKTDFVISNGDFMNNFDGVKNLFSGSIDTLTQIFAKETPLYIVRGNHETRGVMASKLKDYFHFPNGKYHYSFSYGETFFIVLDGGEDKADSDIEYSSLADFDTYRSEEAQWLKNITNSDDFKKSKQRIVFSHIPPYGGGNWHGDIESQKKFVPILNQAKIDLMICGHTHRYSFVKPNDKENNFPILICGNKNKIIVEIDSISIKATSIDIDKKTISTLIF